MVNIKFLRRSIICLSFALLLWGIKISSLSLAQENLPPWRVHLMQSQKLRAVGDLDGAQKSYQVAMQEGELLQGKERMDFWQGLQSFYELKGDYQARQGILEKILAEQMQQPIPSNKDIAITNELLSQTAIMLNNPDEAAIYLNQQLKATGVESGTSSTKLYPILDKLVAIYNQQNKPERAAEMERKKEAIKARLSLCPDDSRFDKYLASIVKITKRHWHAPVRTYDYQTTVRFRAYQDGSIDRLKIYKGTGDDEIDQSALRAVRKSGAFPPHPVNCYDFVGVEVTFDYHVLNSYQPQMNSGTPAKRIHFSINYSRPGY